MKSVVAAAFVSLFLLGAVPAMAQEPEHKDLQVFNDLEGVVQSNVERMLARSLASGFGEFDVKNLLKTDAEVRAVIEPRTTN